jgi:hypothetical protein
MRKRVALAAGLAAALAFGCGGPAPGTLEGRVTFQGKPVTDNHVAFFSPEAGVGASAELDTDGRFRVAGAVTPGRYAVWIEPPPRASPLENLPPPKAGPVPMKYRRQETTDLTVDVAGGRNRFDLQLTP